MENSNQDRISKFLSPRLRAMVFAELSAAWLERIGAADIIGGVPVPVGSGENGTGGAGEIDIKSIVLDMARIIGGDPLFVYADQYTEFIKHVTGNDNDNAVRMLISEGAHSADSGDLEDACMLLRAALRLDPKSRDALYLYARACKEIYESEAIESEDGMGDEEKIGMFKAESTEIFEFLTMLHPAFAMGYYYLGYAYLNLGLYLKAKLTWDDFMKYSSSANENGNDVNDDQLEDLRKEISDRLSDLEDPVRIETGCNMIMGGDYLGGRDILLPFREGRYESWWPLWYYLGVAEASLGNLDEAITDLKKVLTISPSNTDVMDELAQLYEAAGDTINALKYRNKIALIHRNLEEERSSDN
ncbi:MAG: tetratricopeptide repeat protein [Mogibacterium sp.]|nr:tetratricopeptide repeat protein [Mogibacterium sp.]